MARIKTEKAIKMDTDNGFIVVSATEKSFKIIQMDTFKEWQEIIFTFSEMQAITESFKLISKQEIKQKDIIS